MALGSLIFYTFMSDMTLKGIKAITQMALRNKNRAHKKGGNAGLCRMFQTPTAQLNMVKYALITVQLLEWSLPGWWTSGSFQAPPYSPEIVRTFGCNSGEAKWTGTL